MFLPNPHSGLFLLAVIPSLRSRKGLLLHGLLEMHAPAFFALDVPVIIGVKDLGELPESLRLSPFSYVCLCNEDIETLDALKAKVIQGNRIQTVCAMCVLADQSGIVAKRSRFNENSLIQLERKALDHQVQKIKEMS